MFRSVFFAILAALVVYKLLTDNNNKGLNNLIFIIERIFFIIMGIVVILIVINFIINNGKDILKWILYILYGIIGCLIPTGIVFLLSYNKFKQRKKLGLIKSSVKFKDFGSEDDRYKSLTKKEKEIEDSRVKKRGRGILWGLIAIPILLLVSILFIVLAAMVRDTSNEESQEFKIENTKFYNKYANTSGKYN